MRLRSVSFVIASMHPSTKDAVLTSTVHPTQRRLMIALIVTLACLPLLVLDMVQGSASSGATEFDGDVTLDLDDPDSRELDFTAHLSREGARAPSF